MQDVQVQSLTGNMMMVSAEGQQAMIKKAAELAVLQDGSDEESEPEEETQTKEQYLERVAALKALMGGFAKGQEND